MTPGDDDLLAALDAQVDSLAGRLERVRADRRRVWLRMFESGDWPYKRLMILSGVSKTTLSDELRRARAERET